MARRVGTVGNPPGRARALDAGELLATARARAGGVDFADRSFVAPLRRLVASCNEESGLNALGRRAARFEILRSLSNLLQLERRERAVPSLLSRPIERPVFITGMPRSGTTFLHRLLARDPRIAAPLSWQLVYPCPSAAGALATVLRKGWVQGQFHLMRRLAPELDTLHHVAAGEPEECTDITAQVFQSLRYDSVYRVPSYQRWLQRYGHLEAYRFHRRFLQHLDARAPGRRWILKSPDHVFALEDIARVYPDARWVFIHRDPVAVLASVARLTEVLRRPFTDRVDLEEVGRQVYASWLDGAERMMRAAARSDAILHLRYREIVAAPHEAAQRVLRHGGLAPSETGMRRMRKWLGNRGNRKHRPHAYQMARFGLEPQVLRERFMVYTDRFGVDLEWQADRMARRGG